MNRQPAPVFTSAARLHHLVRGRGGEHLAGAGGVEHAMADQARHAAARGRSRRPRSAPPCPASAALRRMNLWPPPSVTMSTCAAAKPSRLSVSTSSTALMNFFMLSSHCSGPPAPQPRSDHLRLAALAGDAGDLLDEVVDRAVERRVLSLCRQDRAPSADVPRPPQLAVTKRPLSRMRCAIGGEEPIALLLAEMADGRRSPADASTGSASNRSGW